MKLLFDVNFEKESVEVTPIQPKTHNSYRLTDADVKLILEGLQLNLKNNSKVIKSVQSKFVKNHCPHVSIDEVVHALSCKDHDLQGLIAMIKESETVNCVISKEVANAGWTFRGHNVDMPLPYAEQSNKYTTEVDRPIKIS